jgi:hypothetical protein
MEYELITLCSLIGVSAGSAGCIAWKTTAALWGTLFGPGGEPVEPPESTDIWIEETYEKRYAELAETCDRHVIARQILEAARDKALEAKEEMARSLDIQVSDYKKLQEAHDRRYYQLTQRPTEREHEEALAKVDDMIKEKVQATIALSLSEFLKSSHGRTLYRSLSSLAYAHESTEGCRKEEAMQVLRDMKEYA